MGEVKLKIADFAQLVGCSPKTVYDLAERKELIKVSERILGRETSIIVADETKVKELQERYGKLPVNNGNYEDILTVNEGLKLQNQLPQENISGVIEKLITLSETYNERLFKVNEELITYKSKIPLLEDKANREGLYLNEIKELKEIINRNEKVNNRNKTWLITVIIILFILLAGTLTFLVYKLNNPIILEKERVIEKLITPQPQKVTPMKAVKRR